MTYEKLIVAGGRDFALTQEGEAFLRSICKAFGVSELVHGDADGVDQCAREFAEANEIRHKAFPAAWAKYGKLAGPLRNKEMALYGSACVVFPGGDGTRSMRREAQIGGLPVFDLMKCENFTRPLNL